MKKTLLISAICLSATTLFAETPANFDMEFAADSLKHSGDTSHFFLGKREILVTNKGNDIHFIRNRFSDENEYSVECNNPFFSFNDHWESLNFGIGGFGAQSFSFDIDKEYDEISVDPIHSFAFHWNIGSIALPLTKSNRVGLVSGVGVTWDFYALSDKKIHLTKGESELEYSHDSIEYKRNKLRTTNLVVPLMLEVHPYKNSDIYVLAGVEGNLRLGARTKQVADDGHREKRKSDYHMNPFTCNLVVRAGYNDFGVFFSTALTPMFKDGRGPVVYPFSAGISLNY